MSGQHRPKAELHVHLEGSVDARTLMEIDPSLTPDEIETRTACGSFAEFLQAYIWVTKKLEKAEHYAIATRRLLENLAAQDVTYAEITLSAGVVLWKGQDLAAVYDAIWRESLRSSVTVRWIPDAIRHFGAEPAMDVARFAVSRAEDGVVAFGIGGDEARGPAKWFKDVFAFARDRGLHLVAHAGETAGPESIWAALEIGAERIGHGIAAADDQVLMAHLRDRGTPLEVCITSNVCTGVVSATAAHPIRKLFEAGVPITLNTDDPALFRTSLDREYEIAAAHLGFSAAELDEVAHNAYRYAFGHGTASRERKG